MKETWLFQIQILQFSYERKTSQALPPCRFYLRSWRQPLARWSVCASSHGHRFFPTGLLRGHRVFSQTPGVHWSAAQSPCAWTTGTGPLNAWGGWEVAPSERLFPLGLWLPRLSDTVHLEWEKQGFCVYVPTLLSRTDSMEGETHISFTLQKLQAGVVTCTEFHILQRGEDQTKFCGLCLQKILGSWRVQITARTQRLVILTLWIFSVEDEQTYTGRHELTISWSSPMSDSIVKLAGWLTLNCQREFPMWIINLQAVEQTVV